MNKKIKELYYDTRTGFQIIGCLLKKPELIRDRKYDLKPNDFYIPFHYYIFSAVHNLVMEGVEDVSIVEIESYISQTSPQAYQVVFESDREGEDGIEWMTNALEHSALANFDYNYNRLKKLSYLRDIISEGIDVSDVLDLQEVDSNIIKKQAEEFNKTSLNELIRHFDRKLLKIKNKYNSKKDSEYKKAGDNADEILKRLKEGETYGLLGFSGYKNRISYGNRRKKFHLCSGGTGIGKSRTALGEIASCVCVELWDYKKQKFIKNPNNLNGNLTGIYVGTELDLDMEVDVILYAIVSGIETSHIIEQNMTEEEEERLKYAIKIIQKSNIHLYNLPNYDISTLDSLISEHKANGEDVYVLGIDYILLTGNLVIEAREYSKGMYTREDQLYLYMSKMFKEELANKHNIYVSSSTQLNRNKSNPDAERDESMIRGSFALCDKIDLGSILLEPTKLELERVEEIIKKIGKWNPLKPTQIEHVFKNRGGKYKKIRIFRHVNLGNMKTVDLFVTDWDFKLLDLEKIIPQPIEEFEDENDKPVF